MAENSRTFTIGLTHVPCTLPFVTQFRRSNNEFSYRSVRDNLCQPESVTDSKCEKFLKEFDIYKAIYEKLETKRRRDLRVRLLDVGKQVWCGTRTWVRQDLDDIASWKGLPPPMLMMERNSSDFEARLESTLRIEDESSRVSALCDIRGMGPIFASAVSMFTWPQTSGFMDHHTSNALRILGFYFPRKHYTSRFTIPQLLTYLRIVRSLAGSKHVNSMDIAEALYALDRARIRNNWREEPESAWNGLQPTLSKSSSITQQREFTG